MDHHFSLEFDLHAPFYVQEYLAPKHLSMPSLQLEDVQIWKPVGI
jgi:hypothetical protein